MSNFFALLSVSYKNTYSLTDGKTKKSLLKKLSPLFVLMALLPSLVSFGFLTREALVLLIPLQQEGLMIGLMLAVMSMIIFFFGIFLIPSIFYFSRDIDTLLSLPLKPEEIVLAKLAVALIFEYITVAFIGAPVLSAYISLVQPTFLFYVVLILVLVLIPIVPLILASLIVMLVMIGLPFAKNKDFFNYLSGFLILGFALFFNMGVTQMASTLDQNAVILLLQQGNNSLMNFYQVSIPTIPFAVKAVVSLGLLDLSIYVLMTFAFILLFILVAKALYFRGVIGITETGANRKSLSTKAYASSTGLRNPILSYALKDLKLMVRTPIYFLNNISTAILMPVILAGTFISGLGSDPEIDALLNTIPWDAPNLGFWMLVFGLSIGFFMSSVNLITPTAISREGSNVWFMKMIPMSYYEQAWAKIWGGLLISLLGAFALALPFAVYFDIPMINYFYISLGIILSSISMNVWGMLVDMLHPKLIWEQEAVPVKQNINALYTMAPGFGLGAGLFFLAAKLPLAFTTTWAIPFFSLLFLALDFVSIYSLKKFANSSMNAIEA